MPRLAIQVEDLGKKYRLGAEQVRYKTLRDTFSDLITAPLRRAYSVVSGNQAAELGEDIWALRRVSFEAKPGEVLGVIGANGAGKSTLLKILSRVAEPTEGVARLNGRVGSLLEVGTGFHPELTGRENIFLNGAILGMKKAEIEKKFDEIAAFSEVERFLDTPVKHYSSGMYMRLAFAVAAHMETDVLLIDEVLAVGDIAFQRKCLGKMAEVSASGRTVLFISHNMQAIRAHCPRCLLLERGEIAADGSAPRVVALYQERMRRFEIDPTTGVGDPKFRRGSGAARFTAIRVRDEVGEERFDHLMGENVHFELSFKVLEDVRDLWVAVAVRGGAANEMVTTATHVGSAAPLGRGTSGTVVISFPGVNLRPGEYPLYFWLGDSRGAPYDVVDGLSAPLVISTDRPFEELKFDPSERSGFFSIRSELVSALVEGQSSA